MPICKFADLLSKLPAKFGRFRPNYCHFARVVRVVGVKIVSRLGHWQWCARSFADSAVACRVTSGPLGSTRSELSHFTLPQGRLVGRSRRRPGRRGDRCCTVGDRLIIAAHIGASDAFRGLPTQPREVKLIRDLRLASCNHVNSLHLSHFASAALVVYIGFRVTVVQSSITRPLQFVVRPNMRWTRVQSIRSSARA